MDSDENSIKISEADYSNIIKLHQDWLDGSIKVRNDKIRKLLKKNIKGKKMDSNILSLEEVASLQIIKILDYDLWKEYSKDIRTEDEDTRLEEIIAILKGYKDGF